MVSRGDLDPNHHVPVELACRLAARLVVDAGKPVEVEVLLPEIRRRWDRCARTRFRGSDEQVSQGTALRLALVQVFAGGVLGGERYAGAGAGEGSELADGVTLRYERIADPCFARITVTTVSGRTESLEGDRSILPPYRPDRRAPLLHSVGGGSPRRVDEAIHLVGALETVGDASAILEVMAGICG